MISSLPPREEEVCLELLKGKSNQDIACALNIRVRTVKAYIGRLFLRFGIAPTEGIPRIRLASRLMYATRPDLVPFFCGDRAAQLGMQSAHEFAQRALAADAAYDEAVSKRRRTSGGKQYLSPLRRGNRERKMAVSEPARLPSAVRAGKRRSPARERN